MSTLLNTQHVDKKLRDKYQYKNVSGYLKKIPGWFELYPFQHVGELFIVLLWGQVILTENH